MNIGKDYEKTHQLLVSINCCAGNKGRFHNLSHLKGDIRPLILSAQRICETINHHPNGKFKQRMEIEIYFVQQMK